MPTELEYTTFSQQAGTTFRVDCEDRDQPLELELVAAESLACEDPHRDPEVRQEPFRLTFRGGPVDAFLPQQVCRMKHASLGDLEIFLVPIGPDDHGMCYEAVFN